jgi:hypothetical protein
MPSDERDPSRRVPYEQARKAQELADAEILRQAREGHQQALEDRMALEQEKGRGDLELDEIRKSHEALVEEQMKKLVEQQRDRMDRLELEYKGPPSERDRERQL